MKNGLELKVLQSCQPEFQVDMKLLQIQAEGSVMATNFRSSIYNENNLF